MLEAKISPMFAAYSGGKLVKTWHGANNKRFVSNMEVPSQGDFTVPASIARRIVD